MPVGYSKRALVEKAFHRYRGLIWRSMQARYAQKVEAGIAYLVINSMTSLGMLVSQKGA